MSDSPDVVIENANLVDGTGAPARVADVAVKGDRVVGIDSPLSEDLKASAGQRLDAKGKVLCPGFVDVHAHGELEPLVDSSAAGKVTGGVTTEISGNCGNSPFPLLGAAEERWKKRAKDGYGWGPERINWTSADEYLQRLSDFGTAMNRGFLLGHGCLRAAVNGYGDNAVDSSDQAAMVRELEAALDAGVFGLSTGLIYPPGCYAPPDEIADLARTCEKRGAMYTTHMRSEADGLEEAIHETLDVTRATGVRTQISHLKVSGQENWHKISFLEKELFAVREEGLPVYADRYPYIAGHTGLDSLLPNWTYVGGNDEELKRIKDDATWARIEAELRELLPDREAYSQVMIAGTIDKELRDQIAGRTLLEIADDWDMPPAAALRRILIEDEVRTAAIFFKMSEENLEKILGWDFVMIGSDATARHIEGPTKVAHPHPRTFGTFTRILARYVREKKLLSLEDAVYRMSGLPAEFFGVRDRGKVEVGAFADLVLFDAETIEDNATFQKPNQFSTGIERVYVNGELVVLDGKVLDARPGQVLRRA